MEVTWLFRYAQELERAIREAYKAALDNDTDKVLEILQQYRLDHSGIPDGEQAEPSTDTAYQGPEP
jgi:hypothetical protein